MRCAHRLVVYILSKCVYLVQVSLYHLVEIHGTDHRLLWRESAYAGYVVWTAGNSRSFSLLLLLLPPNGDHQQVHSDSHKSE